MVGLPGRRPNLAWGRDGRDAAFPQPSSIQAREELSDPHLTANYSALLVSDLPCAIWRISRRFENPASADKRYDKLVLLKLSKGIAAVVLGVASTSLRLEAAPGSIANDAVCAIAFPHALCRTALAQPCFYGHYAGQVAWSGWQLL
jgi:hypothetical protein